MEQEKYNDEIDLVEVFNNLLKSTFFFFNRWYKTLAVSILAGIVLGLGIYLKDKSTYQNTMLGYSPVVHPVLVVDIINALEEINKSDKASIEHLLDIPAEELEKIQSFHADTIETLDKNITTIEIELQYKDSIDIKRFTGKLIKYLNTNPYVVKQLNLKKEELSSLINQTDKELVKLDSLQRVLLKNAGKKQEIKSGFIINNDQIDNFYHKDILSLTVNKQRYIAQLEHLTGFEPISAFKPAKIKGRSLVITVAATVGIIFGIVFFVLLGLEIRRKALHLIHKK